jgi:hypothetical protein
MHEINTAALLTSSFVATANGFETANFFLKAFAIWSPVPWLTT